MLCGLNFFFDILPLITELGLIYNVQSLAMIVSPICMALGGYLAFTAHTEMQLRDGPLPALDSDLGELGRQPSAASLGGRVWAGANAGLGASTSNRANSTSVRESFERFQGTGHKLS